jgi:hypothetical protein
VGKDELRANAARNLTTQSDWKILFDALEEDLFQQWSRTNASQDEERENLHDILTGMRFGRGKAEQWADTAKFEQKRDNNVPET